MIKIASLSATRYCLTVLGIFVGGMTIYGQVQPEVREVHFPTPNPPSIVNESPFAPMGAEDASGTQWSIGQPTDEEQLYLEFINRARANPPAEGARLAATTDPAVLQAYAYYNVDLVLMQSQFNGIAAAPPLAMNAQLMTAARLHSGDMFTNQFQGHVSYGTGTTLGRRLTTQGFNYATAAENVYSYAESPWHGHAGFNVDWGPGTGGMQNPPGHRNSIHGNFREVGIGIVNGRNGTVGPQLVTQDFGTRQSATPLITGVAYYDFNGNSFYDVGEGIGGITVTVPGSSYYAVTAESGGYAVPVMTNGSYTVLFSASNLSGQQVALVDGLRNAKVDFCPVYSPPIPTGPNPAAIGVTNTFTFPQVGAATAYEWELSALAPYTRVEGAENGLAYVTVSTSGGYAVYDGEYAASGANSFHLANPDFHDETITLNATFKAATNSVLNFSKRLGWATANQVARAQVSNHEGTTWTDVWSQPGSGGAGEYRFFPVSVSLGRFAGQTIRVRFMFEYLGGSAYTGTEANVGLRLDDISISNIEQITDTTLSPAGPGSFQFAPQTAGNYQMRVRAKNSGRTYPFGAPVVITAAVPSPEIRISAPEMLDNRVQIDFQAERFPSGTTFQVYRAATITGTFAPVPATIEVRVPGVSYRAILSKDSAGSAFYKIRTSQ